MKTQYPARRSAAALLAIGLFASSCGSTAIESSDPVGDAAAEDEATSESSESSEPETDSGDSETAASGDAETSAGVTAALWGDNVTITVSDGEFRFESDGLPNHELPDQFLVPTEGAFTPPVGEDEVSPVDTDIAVVESPVDQTITLNPVLADEVTDTSLGIIGVAISGAQLFNDYEDQDREFVAVDDSFTIGGVGFTDSCNAHPLALNSDGTGQGNYHYHGVPFCITDTVDVDGEHSTILGFVLDGFPFYGNKGEGGVEMTNADLDECSGHFGATPEFPEGIYHYHLTSDEAPYSIDCYSGEVEAGSSEGGGDGGRPEGEGGPPPEEG